MSRFIATLFATALLTLVPAGVVVAQNSPPGGAPQVITVPPNTPLSVYLNDPDNTILVLPGGRRMTVGELKALIAKLKGRQQLARKAKPSLPPVTVTLSSGKAPALLYQTALSDANAGSQPVSSAPVRDALRPAPTPTASGFVPPHFGEPGVLANTTPDCLNTPPHIKTVNRKTSGVAFTPGGRYRITGCFFGRSAGIVTLQGGSGGGSFTLNVASWTDTEILATLPDSITGVTDQAGAIIVVTPSGGSAVEQGGHSFVAARDTVLLQSLSQADFSSVSGPYRPAGFSLSSAGVNNGKVYYDSGSFSGYCDMATPRTDIFDASRIPLTPGFAIASIAVDNVTDQEAVNNDDYEDGVSAPLAIKDLGGNRIEVDYQLHSTYEKVQLFLGGDSDCDGGYEVAVTVIGPRGIAPLTQ